MERHPITVSAIYICYFIPSRERRGIIPPSVYLNRRFQVGKKVTKHWLSRMHFSISSASPTRWALKWIIKCKLPSVICHFLVRGPRRFFAASRCYSALPRQNLSCGSHFPSPLLSPDGEVRAIAFPKSPLCTLIASQCNGNERPESTEAAQVPVNVSPDPQLLPFGKKCFISRISNQPVAYNNNMEQVQSAETQLRNLFYSGNYLIVRGGGHFLEQFTSLLCETGVSLIGKLLKVHKCNICERFRVLQYLWLWSLLHSIGIDLWDSSEAETGERKALRRSVWACLTGWFWTVERAVHSGLQVRCQDAAADDV